MSKKKKAAKRKTTRATTPATARHVESVIDPERAESWGGDAPSADDNDGGAINPNDPRHWGGGR